jgi:TolB-like protein
MTQPAWPSSTWQILSSDYDTQASFYAVKKASETLHVQLDPTTFEVQVANSLPLTATGLTIRARVFSLDNRLLTEREEQKDAADGVTEAFTLDLAPQLKGNVVLVKLELRDASKALVSDNFYWLGGESADYRKLNRLAAAQIAVRASARREKDSVKVHVRLENTGNSAAIETKLTLLESDGKTRVLPAYYGDNYVSLLPGESKEIDIESPASALKTSLSLGIRGWNVPEKLIQISGER